MPDAQQTVVGTSPSGPIAINAQSVQARGLLHWWPLRGPSTVNFTSASASAVAARDLVGVRHGVNGGSDLTLSTSEMGIGPQWEFGAGAGVSSFLVSTTGLSLTEATISLWMKLRNATPSDANASGFPVTLQGYTGAGSHYPYTDGNLYIGMLADTRFSFLPLAGVDRAQWHHVAISAKAGTNNWRFFQNGQLVYADTVTTLGDVITIFVGGGSIGLTVGLYQVDGWLSDVRLYQRALSDAEVMALYAPQTRWDLYRRNVSGFFRGFLQGALRSFLLVRN